jgi:NAD(P)H-flavin reductase
MANPYLPELATITRIREETPRVKTFTVALRDERPFCYRPGQFVEVSVFGHGEFPVSICALAAPERGCFDFAVRRVGRATERLMDLPVGATIGIRGPFGNGFPLDTMTGQDVLVVAGGVGLSPLKYLVDCLLEDRGRFGRLTLLYGSISPGELLFKETLALWGGEEGRRQGLEVLLTVDRPDERWAGNVGVVTELFGKARLRPADTSAVVCGPSIMMKFATERLLGIGLREDRLFLSLERRMQCGMGMCGHCMMSEKRVCLDGPVFVYEEVKGILEGIF